MEKRIVLFIDENEGIHQGMVISLQNVCGENITPIAILPEPSLDEMLSKICLEYGDNLVSLMLDERLDEEDDIPYLGTQLAEAYRVVDSKIPIYILTSQNEINEDDNGALEYVFDKNDIQEELNYIKQRIRRHIDQYVDIRSERHERLHQLVTKSILEELSLSEEQDLLELNVFRQTAMVLQEHSGSIQLKAELDSQEIVIKEIEKMLDSEG